MLIEDIYRSIGESNWVLYETIPISSVVAYMFPETANWLESADGCAYHIRCMFRALILSIG